MIAVALADRPEVVPVDMAFYLHGPLACRTYHHQDDSGACCYPADHVATLVGQRVALAWRETCPTCEGGGWAMRQKPRHNLDTAPCPDCTDGSRMVVGWTAEVAEVVAVLVLGEDPSPGVDRWVPHIAPTWADPEHVYLWRVGTHTTTGDRYWSVDQTPLGRRDDPTWSPGRYALVLRNVQPWASENRGGASWPTPEPCRPFSGFAELDEVLA